MPTIGDYIEKLVESQMGISFLQDSHVVKLTGQYALSPNMLGANLQGAPGQTITAANQLMVEVKSTDRDTPTPFWVKYASLMEIRDINE